jgi:hypothetical protein
MRRILLLLLLAATAVVAYALLRPLEPVAAPAFRASTDYDEAVGRLFVLLERDSLALHEGCGTTALLTGARAPRAFVLLHGITNCPLQFAELAESLRAGGDNVLVPRVERHGLSDRLTTELERLRAADLVALTSECVGIAAGLGDTVVVAGLSTSGVAAAWAAANLDAVSRAAVLAPAFAPPWKPAWIAGPLTRLALLLPNRFVWWNERSKADLPGPAQCYPRFSTRAMAESYRLGEQVRRGLATRPPRAREVVVVTTAGDGAVDNGRAREFAARCAAGGARVREHAFPAAAGVVHDMIDPKQVGARTGLVYPALLALLRGGLPAEGAAPAGGARPAVP